MSRDLQSTELSPDSAFVAGAIIGVLMLIMGGVAALTHLPWVFPSLGATIFILIGVPSAPPASTKNTVCSHLIGIASGAFALLICGLMSTPPNLLDVPLARVAAITIACTLTAFLMLRLGVPHPPAMATTLIVSLGLIRAPQYLAVMALAVVLLVILARIANYLRGYRLPMWAAASTTIDPAEMVSSESH